MKRIIRNRKYACGLSDGDVILYKKGNWTVVDVADADDDFVTVTLEKDGQTVPVVFKPFADIKIIESAWKGTIAIHDRSGSHITILS